MNFESTEDFAHKLDESDSLLGYRDEFLFPKTESGQDCLYLVGNSLGLQPRKAREYVEQELEDWARLGVEGHFQARHPWMPYHEFLTDQVARVVGAKPSEVVVMNTLSVNLHLMMVSFYRPTPTRFKILTEGGAFPSDQYAVASQARFHAGHVGFDPNEAILEIKPRDGEQALRPDDILETIERHGHEIALILLGNVNYLTGQAFDIGVIAKAGHAKGCTVGFDLAHGAGNLLLNLHEDGPDFAVWCSYKYLNGGPGAIAGCFVHERHAMNSELPRFAGWWGHDKGTRFQMGPVFKPIPGAEGWQLSNPPILSMATLRASLEIFDSATMSGLAAKSKRLTGYLEFLIQEIPNKKFSITTPSDPQQRGTQLSLRVKEEAKILVKTLANSGVVCDFREPDVIRVAPVPLYTRFHDVYRFAKILREHASA